MGKRILIDERLLAHDMFVNDGLTATQIAKNLQVSEETVRNWIKKGEWIADREAVLVTPVAIGIRMKKIILQLMDEIDKKLDAGLPVSDKLILKLDRTTASLTRLDGRYDDKGLIVLAMKRLTNYAIAQNDMEALNVLNRILPGFYRTIQQE